MAAGTTEIADVIVPEIFAPYVTRLTEEKSRIVQAGVLVRDAQLDQDLSGGGLTFNTPTWNDLDNDDDNVSSDTGAASGVKKIGTHSPVAVRLSRNQTWGAADLVSNLAGSDPVASIQGKVAGYWTRRLQIAMIATTMGVFADNDAAPAGGDTHVQGDLTNSIIGGAFVDGVTNFNSDGYIDTVLTMGDSEDELGILLVHSVVFATMKKNNLIDFIPDSEGRVSIPTFQGAVVIKDDGMPNPSGTGAAATAAGIFHSWLFGAGAFHLGVGSAKVPVETDRDPKANNGGGEEELTSRVEWVIHPDGHAFKAASIPPGGPSNAVTVNNLGHADSWSRAAPERKQIKIARLITRES